MGEVLRPSNNNYRSSLSFETDRGCNLSKPSSMPVSSLKWGGASPAKVAGQPTVAGTSAESKTRGSGKLYQDKQG